MKRIFFTLWALGMALVLSANPIDVEAARKIAEAFMDSLYRVKGGIEAAHSSDADLDMTLLYEVINDTLAEPKRAELYVFSPAELTGFVIVAGDDRVSPIVGYSTCSRFRTYNMPKHLEKYLSLYSQYIRQVRKGTSEPILQSEGEVLPVAPLIQTAWGQYHPYNMYCPKVDDKLTITGCTPTALAQIMKYHEWPERGHGTCTATLKNDTATVSTTLGASYEWKNMINNYDYSNSYTASQASAVAQLMKDVGYACNATYGADITTARVHGVVTALLRHFDYSPTIRLVDRNYYSDRAWNDMICHELHAGRPVLCSGVDNDSDVGHSFVCAGVDDSGRYYINWGWGQQYSYNGYFDFNAIAPEEYDYCYQQKAIVHIKPIAEGEQEQDYMVLPHVGRIEITEQDNSLATPRVTYSIYVSNATDKGIAGTIGYAVYKNGVMNSDGIKALNRYDELKPGYYNKAELWLNWSDAAEMSRGVREIHFYWCPKGETGWYIPFGEPIIYMLTINEGHYFSTEKGMFDID